MSGTIGTTDTVGIVGAGIAGRLTAWLLVQRGWQVSLYDQGDLPGTQSCSFAAGGMLAPWSELESAESLVFRLGRAALELWPGIAQSLIAQGQTVYLEQQGSLIVAHPRDQQELERLARQIQSQGQPYPHVSGTTLGDLEPELAGRFAGGLYFPAEGHLGTRGMLLALGQALQTAGAQLHFGQTVDALAPRELVVQGQTQHFDWVVDCRGLAARPNLPSLRGVRGELLRVQAPEVTLKRAVRLMHPRYPLYVVPRPGSTYLIGATSIESEDRGPITVRSSLELLSAAYTLHTGFAEARVLESVVQLRPAFPDNLPRIQWQQGLARLNGLFRHGYLVGPRMAELAADLITTGAPASDEAEVFHPEPGVTPAAVQVPA